MNLRIITVFLNVIILHCQFTECYIFDGYHANSTHTQTHTHIYIIYINKIRHLFMKSFFKCVW